MGMFDAGRKLLTGLTQAGSHAPGAILVDGPSHTMGGHGSHASHGTLPLGAEIDMGIEAAAKVAAPLRQGLKPMASMANAGNLVKAAGRGAGEGYLGHLAFDSGMVLGERMGGTRTDADAEKELQHKGKQNFGENFNEFMVSPAKGIDQLSTAHRGLAKDVQGAYDDAQKTKAMQLKQDRARGAAAMNKPEYGDNIRMLQGLLGNRQQY